MKRLIPWLLILSALVGGGYWTRQKYPEKMAFLKSGADPLANKPGPPTTAVAATRDINFAITAAGEIGPLDTVSVRPEIGGLISTLTLDIGDKVKKGDVLFALNDYDLQTEKTSRKTEIAGAKLAVKTQELLLEKSKLNFERTKGLFEHKIVSKEEYDNARVDYDLTTNSLDIALNRLETAQTALQQVEDKLTKTVIRAPFDCTILTRPISVGQAVSGSSGYNSGTEVFTVANLADMIITTHINQADVTRLKVGQEVTVKVEAIPDLSFVGLVDRIAPQATFTGGVKGFSVRIILRNAEGKVRPGMTANLSIPLVSAGNVLAVPLGAVFVDQDSRYVYVKRDDGRFEHRLIQLGVSDYGYAEVIRGLRDGDVVSLVTPTAGETEASPASADRDSSGGSKKSSDKPAGATTRETKTNGAAK
ncbi:MAG: efflux RND transporter periplasmic adaptor subunit [Phycisphaerae bacterium]|nr:efflux RND transporter periplasmic adaptor subunit [Phycisphaerae bacterium]